MVDLDADGDLDILLANENPFDPSPTGWAQKRLLINNGAGIFADETAARLPVATDQTGAMLPGDIDDDGDLDIVVINRGQEFILVNDGEAVFTNETAARFPPTADSSRGGGLADLDGDCDLDRIARSLPATASIADSNSVSAVTRRGAYSPSGSRHYLQQSRVGSARKRLAAAWRGHDARGLTRDAGSAASVTAGMPRNPSGRFVV